MARIVFHDFAANNGEGRRKQQDIYQQMEETTWRYLSKMDENSVFFANNNDVDHGDLRPIPQFEPNEIQLETMIGMGEFGILLKVKGICLNEVDLGTRNETNVSTNRQGSSMQSIMRRTIIPNLQQQQQQRYHSSVDLASQDMGGNHPVIRELTPLASSNPDLVHNTMSSSAVQETTANEVMVMSQSITIAKLALSTMPMAERTGAGFARRRPSVLSLDQETIMEDAVRRQSVRETLAAQANSSEAVASIGVSSTLDPPIVPSPNRFAIKQVRKDLYPKKKIEAAKDLAREAKFLARLDHPNIVTLRGLVSQAGNPEFGMLLDRLRITLSEELSMWHQREEEIVASSSSRISLLSPVEVLAASIKANWPFFSHQQDEPMKPLEQHSDMIHDNHHRRTSSHNNISDQKRLSSRNVFENPDACWLLGERVLALYDVAQAMHHLHHFKILFRDLKPENVGALGNHRMQIFDFGLAKECKPVDRWNDSSLAGQELQEEEGTSQDSEQGQEGIFPVNGNEFPIAAPASCSTSDCIGTDDLHQRIIDDDKDENDEVLQNSNHISDHEIGFSTLYRMTGLTGTLRIMAPEVIQCLPYGLPADVYSFGVCMWEVFSGQRSSILTATEICRGARLPVPKFEKNHGSGMPPRLQELLQQCWAPDWKLRPDFAHIRHELERQLADLQHQQEEQQSRRNSRSRNASCDNSRDNSPQGRHRHPADNNNNNHAISAAQAAFWNRLETIHHSGLECDVSSSR